MKQPTKHSFSNWALFIGFLLLILLPALDYIFHIAPKVKLRENRDLDVFPEWKWDAKNLDLYPSQFESALNDNFGFRTTLIQLHSLFSYHLLGLSPSPRVTAGKDGWLYYTKSMEEFRGNSTLTEETIQSRIDDWVAKEKYCTEYGIKFLVVIVPNKETVYPEFLPESVQQKRSNYYIDQIRSRIPATSKIEILDLADPLRAGKAIGPTYLKTDTHWSRLGSFIAASEIAGHLSHWFPAIQKSAIPVGDLKIAPTVSDDLLAMMGLPPAANGDINVEGFAPPKFSSVPVSSLLSGQEWKDRIFSPMGFASNEQGKKYKALVLGDSFSLATRLNLFLPDYFQSLIAVCPPKIATEWFQKLFPQIIESEKPDIVIEEMVDRNLDLISKISLSTPPANLFTRLDIGDIKTTGDSFSGSKIRLSASGDGPMGSKDSFGFLQKQAVGNINMSTRMLSQTGTGEAAAAGLMIREDLSPDSPYAFIGFSASKKLVFSYRANPGEKATIIKTFDSNGIWVRLVRSGSSISGYVSAGQYNWKPVGSFSVNFPESVYAGLATWSGNMESLNLSTFGNNSIVAPVPSPSDHMVLWLAADTGAKCSSGINLQTWVDQSGQGHNAIQSQASAQPRVLENTANGLPSIHFEGTNESLQFPIGSSNFSGLTIFMVAKPELKESRGCLLDFSSPNGDISGRFVVSVEGSPGKPTWEVTSGSTSIKSITTDDSVDWNEFQLLEVVQDGNSNGEIFSNGNLKAKGRLDNIPAGIRDRNVLGSASKSQDFYKGDIAEILIYDRVLSSDDRKKIRDHIFEKYKVGRETVAPTFSVSSGSHQLPMDVAIECADEDAKIYFTMDGSKPSTISIPYAVPVRVTSDMTLKAIAVKQGSSNSQTSAITLTSLAPAAAQ